MKTVIVFLSLSFVSASLSGQQADEYARQFNTLVERVSQLSHDFTGSEPAWRSSSAGKAASLDSLLGLLKITHRLGETAMEAVSGPVRSSESRRLRMVAQGTEALSFTINALMNYIDTDDRAFVVLGNDGQDLATRIKKLTQ